MGIRGGAKDYFISKILDYTDSGIARIRLSNFRGKRIIIDWSNIAHRFLNRSKNLAQFINEFINLIHKFAREKIEIVFIFDGKPRDEKTSTIEHRKSIRHKAIAKIGEIIENVSNPEEDFQTIMLLAKKTKTIKIAHVNECKKLFDLLGIHYIHLEDIEADSIFKFLLENDFADVCFSGDMDLLAYGCKYIIQDLDFKEDTVIEIDYEMLLVHLGVSHQQLLMAFILSGTDWNNGLKKSNFSNNLELIKKYGCISSVIANLKEINQKIPEDRHIDVPNKFDWEFTMSIYSEILSPELINEIHLILNQQKKQIASMDSTYGFNVLEEYGKNILGNDPDLKYTKKYQDYIYWKYSYKLNIIQSGEYKQTRKTIRS